MWVLALVGIDRRVRIEAEIVAAAGVLAGGVVVAGDVGAVDVLAVVGAAGGTAAAVVDGTRTPFQPQISLISQSKKAATHVAAFFRVFLMYAR